MQILDAIMKKDNFWSWIFLSALFITFVYIATIIVIRIYYQYFDKKRNDLTPERAANTWVFQPEIIAQRIIAIIISDTCILGACFFYFLYTETFPFFSDFNGFILLLMIIIAIIINNMIDKKMNLYFVDKKIGDKLGQSLIENNAVAYIRLLSSLAVLIIIIGFTIYCKTTVYLQLIFCIIGLVLGRFIYFDTTLESFVNTIKGMWQYKKYMAFALVVTVVILILGIKLDVIETENFLDGVFGGHIFILIIINAIKEKVEDYI